MAEKNTDLNKRLKAYKKFYRGKKLKVGGLTYPDICPDCGCSLTPTGTHSIFCWNTDARGELVPMTIENWRTGKYKGRCPNPLCNAQLICPDCGAPLPHGATECPNEKCPKNSKESLRKGANQIEQFPKYCPRCLEEGKGQNGFARSLNYCSECGLPVMLRCRNNACGHLLSYSDKVCPYCHTSTEWDTRYPDKSKPKPKKESPLNGSFVITPYGPMFVFDPAKEEEEVKAPAPIDGTDGLDGGYAPYTGPSIGMRKGHPVAAVIISILSILLCPLFPLALIGIGLGAGCRQSHPKAGAVAVILSFIGLLACAALCVWIFLYGGWGIIKDLWLSLFGKKEALMNFFTLL